MDLSGRRETTSTLEKSFPARSRITARVSGNSIMVPRMAASSSKTRVESWERAASYHLWPQRWPQEVTQEVAGRKGTKGGETGRRTTGLGAAGCQKLCSCKRG